MFYFVLSVILSVSRITQGRRWVGGSWVTWVVIIRWVTWVIFFNIWNVTWWIGTFVLVVVGVGVGLR